MGEYRLCRSKTAKHPFYIESIDLNIYTIEELCFCFYQNLCLLDDSILNPKLCSWLAEELGMKRLAGYLLAKLEEGAEIGRLILPVFRETGYLSEDEYRNMQVQIARLEIQPAEIRQKIRGDYLVSYGMHSGAIDVYQGILKNRNEGRIGIQFYASVLNNMAAAYARMFLFEEAANCLWQSYELVRSNAVYRRYLAVLPYFLDEQAYKKRLEELRIPKEQLDSIEEEKRQAMAEANSRMLFQDADYEELATFLEQEKKRYHKSRR